jgi:hypothetical protein
LRTHHGAGWNNKWLQYVVDFKDIAKKSRQMGEKSLKAIDKCRATHLDCAAFFNFALDGSAAWAAAAAT